MNYFSVISVKHRIMKRILSLFFSLSVLTTFSQNTEINQLTSDGLKTGKWQKKHSSGELKYEGTFENDTPVGEFNRYDVNGKLTSTLLYSNGGKRAAAYLYNPNGIKLASGIYINQKKDSLWRFFDKEGVLFSEKTYKDGTLHGAYVEYYPDGKVHFQRTYKDG